MNSVLDMLEALVDLVSADVSSLLFSGRTIVWASVRITSVAGVERVHTSTSVLQDCKHSESTPADSSPADSSFAFHPLH